MYLINIVKMLYMTNIVLHFELLKNAKIVRILNEYVNKFTITFC